MPCRRCWSGGRIGETYNVGGGNQRSNLEVVTTLCALLDELVPESKFKPHLQLVKYVTDRPGHDRRYAIDARKLESELGWRAEESFETGLRKTVEWYLANSDLGGGRDQWSLSAVGYAELRESGHRAGRNCETRCQGGFVKGIILAGGSGTRLASGDAGGFETAFAGL